jgi:sugar-specific transcriptional regulator TrmB
MTTNPQKPAIIQRMKQIIEYLEKLDFSETEAKIYLALLQSGPMTVAQLAQAIAINRTAVYPYLSKLQKTGILAEILQNSRKQLVAAEPEKLQYLIQKKEESINAIKETFPEILNTIQSSLKQPKQEERVKVRYYQGQLGVREVYDEALQGTELRSYFNSELIRDVLPGNAQLFLNALEKNEHIKIREILQDTNISHKQRHEFVEKIRHPQKYASKFLPQGVKLSAADILIYDGKVAIVNAGDRNNITGVIMQNSDYYNNSKELFDLMWKMLPETNR